MTVFSRRNFFQKAAGSALAALLGSGAARLQANPLGLPIGAQIYPLRPVPDFAALVKMMAGIGITRLELVSPIGYGADFATLADGRTVKEILRNAGVKAESCHFSMTELRQNQDRSIAWAREVGITQMIAPSLGGGNNPTMDQVKRAADEYNGIAMVAARAGMQQGLHNEGFEVSMVDGRRTYDLLFDLLDPKLVKFQFQMSTLRSGLVAAEYFTRYPGRFTSMHLQDVILAPPAGADARGGQSRTVPVGKGSIDWIKTFKAAKKAGIKSYFLESDWASVQQGVTYLRTLKV